MNDAPTIRRQNILGRFIFLSRWLQAPLYLGLIVAQGVYVYRFFLEVYHLIQVSIFNHPVLDPVSLVERAPTEKDIMLIVLALIDVVMIANLLVMVIVGGYETFVSRLKLEGHPDQPEWLSHVNAGVLKVKLATALIGISSIHLLQTFIEIGSSKEKIADSTVIMQIALHMTFVFSALLLAWTDRISSKTSLEMRTAAH
jgi:uncharacterized protein (TIGR00645 family)